MAGDADAARAAAEAEADAARAAGVAAAEAAAADRIAELELALEAANSGDGPVEIPDAFSARMGLIGGDRDLSYRDDLQEIKGVGPKMESMLNSQGLTTFYQVALLDDEAVDALEGRIDSFPGRIRRDNWVPQAARLHFGIHNEDISGSTTIAELEGDDKDIQIQALEASIDGKDLRIIELEAELEAMKAAPPAPPANDPGPDAFTARLEAVAAERQFGYRDDLKEISGVGPKMESMLNSQGLTTFYQVALLDDEAVDALEGRIDSFPGRIRRDNWVPQAARLHYGVHDEDISSRVVIAETEQDAFTAALAAQQMADEEAGTASNYVDNLQEISGVGPKMNRLLNGNGLYTFLQVSRLDDEAVDALNDRLEFFPGRIRRDEWVRQAGELHQQHHG